LIGKKEIENMREKVSLHEPPILSLYVDVDPAKAENARKGWLVRVKNSLKELKIPRSVEDKVLAALEKNRPEGKTHVIFAAEKDKRVWLADFTLQVELPVVHLGHGRVEARWGEPYVAPLIYALDEYELYSVVFINKKRWRLFKVYLGEIEEVMDVFNEISPEDWRRITSDSPSLRFTAPKPASARAGAAVDKFARKINVWTQKFYKNVVKLLENFVNAHDIGRIILMGVSEETRFFEQYLSRSLRDKIVAHLASLPTPEASVGDVSKKILPVIEKIEREKEIELITQIKEQPGIWGLENVLDALQMGKLYVLVVPWNLGAEVWRCPETGLVFSNEETAKELCPDEKEKVLLRDIIVSLAADYGTRLEFVKGEAEKMLIEQMEGVAGLTRW
jgi:hypothetical protein